MGGLQLEVPNSDGLRVPGQTSTDIRRSKSATGPLEISKTEVFFKGQSYPENEAPVHQPLNKANSDSDISLKVPESHLLKRTASAGLVWFQDLWRKKADQEPIGPTLTSKYIIAKRRIGSGATSQIQLVRKIGDDAEKKLAVKMFYKKWTGSGDVEARVGEEFCLTSGLTHKNVIKVYELIQDDLGHWCQVMEYCPGGDLRNVIQNGFLNLPEIDCCFRQLIDGVAYMHSMGIAHRDIKPENILIGDDCVLKISDFGCSEAFYDSIHIPCNKSSGMIGSEPYMAPEILKAQQCNSVTTYDARLADIWACGIVYLVMSLGIIPFKMADELKDQAYAQYVKTRLTEEEYPLFRALRKGAKDCIVKILDPDTQTRATMNDIISSQWFNSIEICHKGQAESAAFHSHFSQDYSPERSP